MSASNHAVVIPVYGDLPLDWTAWVVSLFEEGFWVVLVENNPEPLPDRTLSLVQRTQPLDSTRLHVLRNNNQGGVAGGFNRGIERAIGLGAQWVTFASPQPAGAGIAEALLAP